MDNILKTFIERYSTEKNKTRLKELENRIFSSSFVFDEVIYAEYQHLKTIQVLSEKIMDIDKRYNYLHQIELEKQTFFSDDLLKDEKNELKSIEENTKKEIQSFILSDTKLDFDDLGCIIEIRPGIGGAESSIFAEQISRAYMLYFAHNNVKFELISNEFTDSGVFKECVINIEAPSSYGRFRFESGILRVQRIPTTESKGRVHTSTVSFAVLPFFESSIDSTFEINEKDIRIDIYRSSGPGGQSVNTTDSAVRITHLPSGITAACQNGKSQHQNKYTAMRILKSKLLQHENQKKENESKRIRKATINSNKRSSKIRTYNFPQSRITDHRLEKSWFFLKEAMNGDLDEIIKETNEFLRHSIYQSQFF